MLIPLYLPGETYLKNHLLPSKSVLSSQHSIPGDLQSMTSIFRIEKNEDTPTFNPARQLITYAHQSTSILRKLCI